MKERANKLIVFVLSLDSNHMLFSHHREIVQGLAKLFKETIAISSDVAIPKLQEEIVTLRWRWDSNHKYLSSIRLCFRGFVLLSRNKDAKVLFIQADKLSALLSPLCFLLRIPCFLWYAHGNKSLLLRFSKHFLTSIFTANRESCSIVSPNVKIVGHYVDHKLFSPISKKGNKYPRQDFFHLGRLDRSKRIFMVASAVDFFGSTGGTVNLFLLGAPSNDLESQAHEVTLSKLRNSCKHLNIIDVGQVSRWDLPSKLESLGIFVHAFQGSLDKAMLEGTLMLNPVATINKGYLREFGQWSNSSADDEVQFLIDEITAIREYGKQELTQELIRRRDVVLANHILDSWLEKVTTLMKEG